MQAMPTLSFALNVLIFSTVCYGLYYDTRWVRVLFGQRSPARNALFAIYLAALLFSAVLMLGFFPSFVLPLLLFHIATILLVPFTYQSVRHPVVITYLVLAAVHSVTVATIWPNNLA